MEVKIARIKKGLTQEKLCKMLKISKTTLVKIEKGNYECIKIGLAKEIAKVLGSTVQELFLND
ncbi:helix-turn-helix transcriptional regulator [Clostridium sporogenes]|uniref:helix-turn-helix transcriptional regulator n=1 Tax=Clostridium sporogenes TaxID=1509 RepID=UPI0005ED7092|nr:helix-turn-helix transcriptional regulator [Clostridium sporogenes]MBW5459019.1 helix-turn-helix domain-containing protein [Clostridium sporogenes]